ncbi:MAG: transcriptional regulator [Verrucomicrobia bacterium]|nr:MAG: transcriptional regulator [Verrucomicrobiota bacterium]
MTMTEKELASLGAAEAEILKIVWELKEATVQQIWERLPAERNIAPTTVQTVLRRLRQKGYVKSSAEGKAHTFSPAIKPERVISKTVGDLVNRFFGGDAVPLLMHLARTRKIAREDLKRLQDLLKRPKTEN